MTHNIPPPHNHNVLVSQGQAVHGPFSVDGASSRELQFVDENFQKGTPPKKRQRTTTGQSQIHKSTKSSSKVTGKNVHIEYAQIIFLLVFPKHYDLTMCMILHSSCVVQDNLNRLRMTQNSWEHMYKPKANVTPFSTNEGLWFFKGPGNISLCILRDGCLFFYVTPSLLLSVLLLDSPFSGISMSLL